jgi:hypothetical protein
MLQKNVHTLQEFVGWTLASSEPPVAALGILCVCIIEERSLLILDGFLSKNGPIRIRPRHPGVSMLKHIIYLHMKQCLKSYFHTKGAIANFQIK